MVRCVNRTAMVLLGSAYLQTEVFCGSGVRGKKDDGRDVGIICTGIAAPRSPAFSSRMKTPVWC
jgi:hypothetical protein